MEQTQSVQELMGLKQEGDVLLRKVKLGKALSIGLGICLAIALVVFLNFEVRYDLVPIDKSTFAQYSLSSPLSEFAQAKVASIEDIFFITTHNSGQPDWRDMFKYDSTGLTDSSAAIYEELEKRYDSVMDQPTYSHLYAICETVEGSPCILRMWGEESNSLSQYLRNWEELYEAFYGWEATPQPVYGRLVSLTPASEMDTPEILTPNNRVFFRGGPAGMTDNDYYRLLETYPVIDLEDAAAFDKVANPGSVTNNRIALTALVLVGAAFIALRIFLAGTRRRFEAVHAKAVQLTRQVEEEQEDA